MPKSNENLIKLSSDKDNYINEWLVISKTKVCQSDIERRCICCGQDLQITWEKNTCINIINLNDAIMGSDCITILNEKTNIKINDEKQIRKNIITLFHEGFFNKILNLEEYVINVLFDYLRSGDKNININIDFLKKFMIKYANNKIIYDELCKILELKIEEEKKEDQIRIKQKEEEEKRIKIQEERIRLQEEREENIKLQKEEEKLKNIQLSIQKKEEEKQLKIEKFQIINEKLSFNCNSIPNHLACVDKYYIYKKDVNYKICKFCFNYYIDSKICLEFAR
jgi:hypothetical protein